MELTIAKKDIFPALGKVVNILNPKPTVPALAHVLIEATGEELRIQGTDLELGVKICRNNGATRSGRVLVPGRKFFEIIREFPEAEITLASERENTLRLAQGRIKMNLVGLKPDDFILPSPVKEPKKFNVGTVTLRGGINSTRAVVAVSDTSPQLSGIFLTTEDGWLTMVSTDTRRLARYRSKVNLKEEIRFIIPVKTADTIRGLWDEETELTVELGAKQVVFSGAGITLTSQLIEGAFPDYTRVIPDEDTLLGVEIPRENLIAALRRMKQIVSQGKNTVRVDVKPGMIIVSGEAPGVGEGQEEIEISYNGQGETVYFNPDYLLDGIRNLVEEETVFLGINPNPDKPNIIRNVKDNRMLYLVMPIKG